MCLSYLKPMEARASLAFLTIKWMFSFMNEALSFHISFFHSAYLLNHLACLHNQFVILSQRESLGAIFLVCPSSRCKYYTQVCSVVSLYSSLETSGIIELQCHLECIAVSRKMRTKYLGSWSGMALILPGVTRGRVVLVSKCGLMLICILGVEPCSLTISMYIGQERHFNLQTSLSCLVAKRLFV